MASRRPENGARSMTRSKILPIILPPTLYKELERRAHAEDRDALQQARWILKRELEKPGPDLGPVCASCSGLASPVGGAS